MSQGDSNSNLSEKDEAALDLEVLMARGERVQIGRRTITVCPAVLGVWEELATSWGSLVTGWLRTEINALVQAAIQSPGEVAAMLPSVAKGITETLLSAPAKAAQMFGLVGKAEDGTPVPADWFRLNAAPDDVMTMLETIARVNDFAHFFERGRRLPGMVGIGLTSATPSSASMAATPSTPSSGD
jgi:hypothetical protein